MNHKSAFICHSRISVLRNIRNPVAMQGKYCISFLQVNFVLCIMDYGL